jgi:hypothetical protein
MRLDAKLQDLVTSEALPQTIEVGGTAQGVRCGMDRDQSCSARVARGA